MKPVLCLDFDGVLHSYTSGWTGADNVIDQAVPGSWEFLEEAAEHFTIHVFSSRSNQPGGIKAMKEWMSLEFGGQWVAENIMFPTYKPPAMLTIDDRAITFTGEWPVVAELLTFRPWNKQ